MLKRCSKCELEKPPSEFTRDSRAKDGLFSYCKGCGREHVRKWRAANRDRATATSVSWAKRNPDKVKAASRKYQAKRRAAKRAALAARLAEFPSPPARSKGERPRIPPPSTKCCSICKEEKPAAEFSQHNTTKDRLFPYCRRCHAARSQAWQQQHPDLQREYVRRAYENKRRVRAGEAKQRAQRQRGKLTRAERLFSYTVKRNRRRARLTASSAHYTAAEWDALCAWFGNVCLGCGLPGPLAHDHVIPISKGGSNSIANMQPLCISCNSRKGAQPLDYRDPVQLAAFLKSLEQEN